MCRYGGSGWTAARIGSGDLGDSLGIWPLRCALLLTCPQVAGSGLAHRVDLIRSLSARWRDPSQMCHPVTPPSPSPGPFGAGAELAGVSCVSATACTAAGHRTNSKDYDKTLIESGTATG